MELDKDLLRQACLIGGQWVQGAASVAVTNPSTGKKIGAVPDFGAEETRRAVAAASAALPAWRERPAKERG